MKKETIEAMDRLCTEIKNAVYGLAIHVPEGVDLSQLSGSFLQLQSALVLEEEDEAE